MEWERERPEPAEEVPEGQKVQPMIKGEITAGEPNGPDVARIVNGIQEVLTADAKKAAGKISKIVVDGPGTGI